VEDINLNLLEDNTIIDEYQFTFVTHGYESLITEPTSVTGVSSTCIDYALFKSINKNKLEVSSAVININITDHCAVAVWFGCLPPAGTGAS
jgi:hypothetical protein